jgi:TonB family protein
MSDRKTCVKCGRTIDRFSKICPFCNWDQNEPIVAKAAPAEGPLPAYQPPAEPRWRKPIFGAIGGFLGIIAAFVIGVHVHGNKPPTTGPGHEAPVAAPPALAQERPHANVTLVPDAGPAPSVEQPITSAPATETAQGLNNELQRTDATAASSNEYAQMAKRAQAEKKRMAAVVDPRSITGAAYDAVGPHEERSSEPASLPPAMYSPLRPSLTPAVQRTSPVPEYQPLPRVRVRVRSVARVELIVGPDGRVRDINVQQGLGSNTAALINAVQSWRFKPATENGHPVAAPFTVELSFNADE